MGRRRATAAPRSICRSSSALALLADERSPVGLISGGGLETVGELVAAGDDVLTVRTAPPARRLVYVPLDSVAVCELR